MDKRWEWASILFLLKLRSEFTVGECTKCFAMLYINSNKKIVHKYWFWVNFNMKITQNSSVAHTFNYLYSAKSPEYFQLCSTLYIVCVCVLYFPISFNLFEFYGMKSVDTIYIFVLQPEIHICEHHKNHTVYYYILWLLI